MPVRQRFRCTLLLCPQDNFWQSSVCHARPVTSRGLTASQRIFQEKAMNTRTKKSTAVKWTSRLRAKELLQG